MTQQKSPVQVIKDGLDSLPDPARLPYLIFSGEGNAGLRVPASLSTAYRAALIIIQGMVKNGTNGVDGSAIVVLRDAVMAVSECKQQQGFRVDELEKIRMPLLDIFYALEYVPPVRPRTQLRQH